MDIPKNVKRVVITIGPSENPYAKIFLPDNRSGEKDRRKSHAFLTQDRRSGIADRRSPES